VEATTGLDLDNVINQLTSKGLDKLKNFATQLRDEVANQFYTEHTNQVDKRAEIAAGGWSVVYGTLISDFDYAKVAAALVAAASGNPGPLYAYVQDLVDRNVQKILDTAPGIGADAIKDILLRVISGSSPSERIGQIEVKGGLATYSRTGIVNGVPIPLFNDYQLYLAFRFHVPDTDNVILSDGTDVFIGLQPPLPQRLAIVVVENNAPGYVQSYYFSWGPDYPTVKFDMGPHEVKVLAVKPIAFATFKPGLWSHEEKSGLVIDGGFGPYSLFPDGKARDTDSGNVIPINIPEGIWLHSYQAPRLNSNYYRVLAAPSGVTLINPFSNPDYGVQYLYYNGKFARANYWGASYYV
jgi:hypothetical protein